MSISVAKLDDENSRQQSASQLNMQRLHDHGWTSMTTGIQCPQAMSGRLQSVARELGSIAPGRNSHSVELVAPEDVSTAKAGSLSSAYGMAPLPLHNDTAHWPTPCRYILLACMSPGPTPTSTILLDIKAAKLTADEIFTCRNEAFLIKNGKNSFYGMMMETGRPFLRVDPGCMVPISSNGQSALNLFEATRHQGYLNEHNWNTGDIIVIDNWRMLHGRGFDQPTARGRVLMRVMVR